MFFSLFLLLSQKRFTTANLFPRPQSQGGEDIFRTKYLIFFLSLWILLTNSCGRGRGERKIDGARKQNAERRQTGELIVSGCIEPRLDLLCILFFLLTLAFYLLLATEEYLMSLFCVVPGEVNKSKQLYSSGDVCLCCKTVAILSKVVLVFWQMFIFGIYRAWL